MTERWRVAHLEELESDGRRTLIRRLFGIQAFGVSAWPAVGDRTIDDHDEVIERHEELYLVLRGRATFSAGRHEEALDRLARAVELHPKLADYARDDSDFDAIREDPRFPR